MKWWTRPPLIGSAHWLTRPKHDRPTAAGRPSMMSSPPVRTGRIRDVNDRQVEVLMMDERRSLNPSPFPLSRVECLLWPKRSTALWEVDLLFNMKEMRKNKAHTTCWARLNPRQQGESCCSAISVRTKGTGGTRRTKRTFLKKIYSKIFPWHWYQLWMVENFFKWGFIKFGWRHFLKR